MDETPFINHMLSEMLRKMASGEQKPFNRNESLRGEHIDQIVERRLSTKLTFTMFQLHQFAHICHANCKRMKQ